MDPLSSKSKWPKIFPDLTPEQVVISNDFMRHWHEILPKIKFIDQFNHRYIVKNAPKTFRTTLEIGAGLGEHLNYENLTNEQEKNYVAVDIRNNMIEKLTRQFPKVQSIVGDCQKKLPFEDDSFDRIIAIHVLEHLPNLPRAITELYRLCNKSSGKLQIVIPCEGGLAYSLARKISAQRIFEKKYKQSYQWFIEREHINIPKEIFEELSPYFQLEHTSYFPLALKYQFCNLCIGATFLPKKV